MFTKNHVVGKLGPGCSKQFKITFYRKFKECILNFRCFEYAHLADRLSNSVPEYRQEYEKIALHCRELSVELLDHCNKTTEIDRILRESGCSSKYFRNSEDMTYPRHFFFETGPLSLLSFSLSFSYTKSFSQLFYKDYFC